VLPLDTSHTRRDWMNIRKLPKRTVIVIALLGIVGVYLSAPYLQLLADKQLSISGYSFHTGESQLGLPIGSTAYFIWPLSVNGRVKLVSVTPMEYQGFVIEEISRVRGSVTSGFLPYEEFDEELLDKLAGGNDVNGLVLRKPEDYREQHYIVIRIRTTNLVIKGPLTTRIDYKWYGVSASKTYPQLAIGTAQ